MDATKDDWFEGFENAAIGRQPCRTGVWTDKTGQDKNGIMRATVCAKGGEEGWLNREGQCRFIGCGVYRKRRGILEDILRLHRLKRKKWWRD